jgi:cbb3-type cytochrome oxidase cytochrome c subunit
MESIRDKGQIERVNNAPGFETITFNGVKVYIKDGIYFNATKLFKAFKNYTAKNGTERVKASFYSWINGAGKGFKSNYPDYFINVFGRGT